MFPNIEFNEAAFRHGLTEDNIRYVLQHPLREKLIEGYQNKWMVIGYDANANLIEIAYNIVDNDTVNVFHAMPLRSIYFPLLNQWRN